ncbi:MAG: hypothetical protein RBS56_02925 [Candidatus Gracilibacteria bacterium]|jgi:hypothetical protein|nr:hypothetical protein [Candidatus Gracilibacteria bacterium]
MNELAIKLRERIPFLRFVSDDIYFALDFSEFFLPNDFVNGVRRRLEDELFAYVMTYKFSGISLDADLRRYLCGNLKMKKLSAEKLLVLRLYEEKVIPFGVSFGVYERPIEYVKKTMISL